MVCNIPFWNGTLLITIRICIFPPLPNMAGSQLQQVDTMYRQNQM